MGVKLTFGGKLRHPVCGLTQLKIDLPDLFAKFTADCHPTATNSRRYSPEDCKFIEEKV